MTNEEMNALAEKAIADFKDLDEIKGGVQEVKTAWANESNVLKKVFAAVAAGAHLVTDVVEYVEELAMDAKMAGSEKRDLAVAIVNKLIDLPIAPENVEAILIGFTIDTIVTAFNRKFGKAWLSKLP